jgi:flagellar basal body-associated protein FliL
MSRLLSRLLPLFAFSLAQAQTTQAETPIESASGATVVAFLVLFVGSIVGFVAYSMWLGKKKRQRGEE